MCLVVQRWRFLTVYSRLLDESDDEVITSKWHKITGRLQNFVCVHSTISTTDTTLH